MLSIDEAQIMLKAKAKCIERICKGIYEDCNEQKCDNCDLCYAQGTNGEQIELMLQCAEWLEELKALRLLLDWAIECDFGLDSFPEEYEKYKHTLTDDMTYKDMIIQIAKCVVAEEIKEQNR